MQDAARILDEHPYVILFLAVMAEQIGLPFPAVLFLLAAGNVAASGGADLAALLLTGVAATLLADLVWFVIGRRRGGSIARLVTKLSPDPDGAARRAWGAFARRGERILLWAKFVPGLSTFTTPLAGAARIPLARFLGFDTAAAILWCGAYLAAGFGLGPEVVSMARAFHDARGSLWVPLLLSALTFAAWRYLSGRRARRRSVPAASGRATGPASGVRAVTAVTAAIRVAPPRTAVPSAIGYSRR